MVYYYVCETYLLISLMQSLIILVIVEGDTYCNMQCVIFGNGVGFSLGTIIWPYGQGLKKVVIFISLIKYTKQYAVTLWNTLLLFIFLYLCYLFLK